MKKLLIVLLAVVLFSCSKEDEPKPYQNPIVEGCECGTVTGYDIRTLSGTTYYYLDYKRDFPRKLEKTISAMANTFGGIVLIGVEEDDQSKTFGFILWDTEKENDIEDWSGFFGSFIELGGIELSQNYQFQHIKNENENEKK